MNREGPGQFTQSDQGFHFLLTQSFDLEDYIKQAFIALTEHNSCLMQAHWGI